MSDVNPNNEQKAPEKLEMINLNQHKLKSGVGSFFAVCRAAINSTTWKHSDFKKVELTMGQLDYLEKYCKQEFPEAPKPEENKEVPKVLTPSAPEKNEIAPEAIPDEEGEVNLKTGEKKIIKEEVKPAEEVAKPTPPTPPAKPETPVATPPIEEKKN